MINYLKGIANPFGLADPPVWWLRQLAKFDNQLVIFPSQKDPVFRLGRRARFCKGVKPADVPGVENHPDTVVMCKNDLVPVTTVMPGATWDQRVFEKLAERDMWRMGGAKAVVKRMEDAEAKQEEMVQRRQDAHLDAINADAYASMKYRTGQRVSMAHTGASNNKRSKPQRFDMATSPRVVLATA